jgi:hypothetical protein
MGIEVTQLTNDLSADFVFEVVILEHKYRVTLSDEYYERLTEGDMDADELVEKSFEFLLKREEPDEILSEFDLSVISEYFPQYEDSIRKLIK